MRDALLEGRHGSATVKRTAYVAQIAVGAPSRAAAPGQLRGCRLDWVGRDRNSGRTTFAREERGLASSGARSRPRPCGTPRARSSEHSGVGERRQIASSLGCEGEPGRPRSSSSRRLSGTQVASRGSSSPSRCAQGNGRSPRPPRVHVDLGSRISSARGAERGPRTPEATENPADSQGRRRPRHRHIPNPSRQVHSSRGSRRPHRPYALRYSARTRSTESLVRGERVAAHASRFALRPSAESVDNAGV